MIWIASGTGYAGSVLASSQAGQWFADGVALAGQTGMTLTVTPALEGAVLRQGGSNAIQMFAPVLLPESLKTGGGQWMAEQQSTVSRSGVDYVTAWPNRFGGVALEQATAANQPRAGTINGIAAAIWSKSPSYQSLTAASAFTPRWWIILAQFAEGTELADEATTGSSVLRAYLLGRGSTDANSVGFSGANLADFYAADGGLRVNGAAALQTTGILPRPLSTLSFAMKPEITSAFAWSLGRGYDVSQNRQWVGPILGAVALAAVPDEATRQKLEGYLHWKSGQASRLATSHPYRAAPPRLS